MTDDLHQGADTGPDRRDDRAAVDDAGLRGTNQSGMRAHNERLVLSLVRQQGPLAKSDIARISGLSAQTVSVIMRALEQDGLLIRGNPVRGRIGQPSIPMRLDSEGAFFFGLKIGRRSADLVLINFLGQICGMRRRIYRYPTPSAVVEFVTEALPELIAILPPDRRGRIGGMGIAIPFQLWSWVTLIGAPQSEMDAWRERDIQAELAQATGMPVFLRNDATAACKAELVFGTGDKPRDFLYFYFGYFIGGGLVLNGQLYVGRTGNAAGVGPMPVPGENGEVRRLITVASLVVLADAIDAAGQPSDQLWERPDHWDIRPDILSDWIELAAKGLASAILSATTLLELSAVLIDGWMPQSVRAELTRRTADHLSQMDLSGIDPPMIRQGTVGPGARALGAAAIPLSMRYLIDPDALREPPV